MLKKRLIPTICLLVLTLTIVAGIRSRSMPFGTLIMHKTGDFSVVAADMSAAVSLKNPQLSYDERKTIASEIRGILNTAISGSKTSETEKYFEPEFQDLAQAVSGIYVLPKYNFVMVSIDGITARRIRLFQKTFPGADYVVFFDAPSSLDSLGYEF